MPKRGNQIQNFEAKQNKNPPKGFHQTKAGFVTWLFKIKMLEEWQKFAYVHMIWFLMIQGNEN